MQPHAETNLQLQHHSTQFNSLLGDFSFPLKCASAQECTILEPGSWKCCIVEAVKRSFAQGRIDAGVRSVFRDKSNQPWLSFHQRRRSAQGGLNAQSR